MWQIHFFLLDAAWVRSRASALQSATQAISCKYTTKTLKQISGSNKFKLCGRSKSVPFPTFATAVSWSTSAWESLKHCRIVEGAMMGFNIENLTTKQALLDAKDKHARRWQTKEGTYRLKGKLLDTDVEMADISTV